jgi:vacuolar-type H+-ATPase subunit I/STV1
VFKFFQKKPQILSQRVVVRPHRSWQFYLAVTAIVCSLLAALSWGMYEAGRHSVDELDDRIEEKISYLFDPGGCRQTKKQKLCTQIGDLIQQVQISNTANQNLAEEVKSLAAENDHLKEKLEFFHNLVANNTKSGISIYQFSLKETQIPGQYRYALTLIQGGERPNDFKGNLRFKVKLLQKDQSKVIPLVNKNSKQDFPINFKFIHRLEEHFQVSPDTSVESIQVQIYKNGDKKPIVTETVQPAS